MRIGYLHNGKALDKSWNPMMGNDDFGKRGIHCIFRPNGKLNLLHDEKFILDDNEMNMDVRDGWGARGGTSTYSLAGYLYPGKIIVTNKRIIHYRKPDPARTSLDYSDAFGGIVSGAGPVLKANEARKKGMLEFCELTYEELVRITSIKNGEYVSYSTLSNWDRKLSRIYNVDGPGYMEKSIYEAVTYCLKEKELTRTKEKKAYQSFIMS